MFSRNPTIWVKNEHVVPPQALFSKSYAHFTFLSRVPQSRIPFDYWVPWNSLPKVLVYLPGDFLAAAMTNVWLHDCSSIQAHFFKFILTLKVWTPSRVELHGPLETQVLVSGGFWSHPGTGFTWLVVFHIFQRQHL